MAAAVKVVRGGKGGGGRRACVRAVRARARVRPFVCAYVRACACAERARAS